jgi:fructokinase
MIQANTSKITCFGEVLWDIFPGKIRRAGGAPFNVAYHLFRMGIDVAMISSVGNDALGQELLEKIDNWKISTAAIQVSNRHPTSTVVASIDENNEAKYEILSHVAWDYIETRAQDRHDLASTDAFVFGTLAAREHKSRNTLFQLLESSAFNVFDINLRPPFYDVNLIKELLHRAHLAKFNKAELRMVLDVMGKEYRQERDSISYLQDSFQLPEIIVSKGSKGAIYATNDEVYLYPTVSITVKDTVGSGDSFLAGFLSKRFEAGVTTAEIMQQAVALGAFITAQEGACPEYSLADFVRFRDQHPIVREDLPR